MTTLHFGRKTPNYLLLPIIPDRDERMTGKAKRKR